MKFITPKQLVEKRNHDHSLLLLDIRDAHAFKDWHIKESQNIPVSKEIWAGDFDTVKKQFESLPKNKTIVTICNAGITAQKASTLLESMDYTTLALEGGMKGWSTFHVFFSVFQQNDLLISQIVRPGKGCLSYLISSNTTKECFVVDASQFIEEYTRITKELGLKIIGVIDTHVHADHISGAHHLAALTKSKYYVSSKDFKGKTGFADLSIASGIEIIEIGENKIKIIETPGHTEGSVCLLVNNTALITGDTLFLDGVGRPDLGRDENEAKQGAQALYYSLNKIKKLDRDIIILPAHCTNASVFPVRESLFFISGHNSAFTLKNENTFVQYIVSNLPKTPTNYEQIKNINANALQISKENGEQLEFGPNRCASN